ncbi:MAG: LamG domain-containing protein [Thermoanaerobaculia bacterium]
MTLTGASGYVEIPHNAALNPTSAFTFEAWVSVTDANGVCSSIAGKGYSTAWWVGICGTTLRSYLQGGGSRRDGGTLDAGWNHIAITYDGTTRLHYINGEIVGTFPDTGPLTTNSSPVRIASDVNWVYTPAGAMNEVRLWNVARTTGEIRGTINVPMTTATPGLVAVWSLNASGNDALATYSGTLNGATAFLTFPPSAGCAPTATSLCFEARFSLIASWRAPDGSTGVGRVVPGASSNSGLFWFFSSDNWELLVKELNGCALNSRRWVFSAATTNVQYRLTVLDQTRGAQKIYFNYQGLNAPAVTDTSAFATCP